MVEGCGSQMPGCTTLALLVEWRIVIRETGLVDWVMLTDTSDEVEAMVYEDTLNGPALLVLVPITALLEDGEGVTGLEAGFGVGLGMGVGARTAVGTGAGAGMGAAMGTERVTL